MMHQKEFAQFFSGALLAFLVAEPVEKIFQETVCK